MQQSSIVLGIFATLSVFVVARPVTGPHFQGMVNIIDKPTIVFHGVNAVPPVRHWKD